MARAYSQDLRDRVIDAVASEGLSRRAAARRFGVSAATAVKWLQRFQRSGARESGGTGGHRPSKIQPHRAWVLAVLAAQPDITLAALAARLVRERGVQVDTSMLSRFFTGEGISFKKKASRPPSRPGRTSRSGGGGGSTRKADLIRAASSSSMRPGPRRT